MIYLRARYYNPDIGRFINEDPIKDGLNWYAYCGNNPIMFIDPSGLKNKGELIKIGTGEVNDVKVIQTYLNNYGYKGKDNKPLSVDGDFGANTKFAVEQFQKDNGLKVDGIVGDKTWVAMGFAFNSINIPIGPPNSTQPIYDRNGNIVGQREFGPDGKAVKDTDYTNHGNPKQHPDVPHEHKWTDEGRSSGTPVENSSENSSFGFWVMVGAGAILVLDAIQSMSQEIQQVLPAIP